MITITPISSMGTRDDKNQRNKKNDKYNDNKYNPISFKEFLDELHLEQTEQM
jgi:hypothetical protein